MKSLKGNDPFFDALTDIDFEEKNITAVDVSVPDLVAGKFLFLVSGKKIPIQDFKHRNLLSTKQLLKMSEWM